MAFVKATERFYPVVLFIIMMYKGGSTSTESVDKNHGVNYGHS